MRRLASVWVMDDANVLFLSGLRSGFGRHELVSTVAGLPATDITVQFGV